MRVRFAVLMLTGALGTMVVAPALASGPGHYEGFLNGGAAYVIDVPENWDGTLLLYAHGYNTGPANPAVNMAGHPIGQALLARGFALAGSSYRGVGWQVPSAIQDQIATLDEFDARVGQAPTRTIAVGHSMGGEITTLMAERHPDRIDGAVPLCPANAGPLGWFNGLLDGAITLETLLDPGGSGELVDITNPFANLLYWQGLANAAQSTPNGRARLALAAAFMTLPGWSDLGSPEPAATDYIGRQLQQFHTLSGPFAFFQSFVRADLERNVGGPFSWNTGVNYKQLFAHVDPRAKADVRALYDSAGLDLDQDLTAINAAPRVAQTDAAAIDFLGDLAPRGELSIPVLTLHTTGDSVVWPSQERIYADTVHGAGSQPLVRQAFVHAPGHCNFTASETVAVILTMVERLNVGHWAGTATPEALNALASSLNAGPSTFVRFHPARLLRP